MSLRYVIKCYWFYNGFTTTNITLGSHGIADGATRKVCTIFERVV